MTEGQPAGEDFRFFGYVIGQADEWAGYVEQLGQRWRPGGGGLAGASVKQHLSTLRMLGDFWVVCQRAGGLRF